MKTYARIQEGRVAELLETDGDITQMFHPSLVWVEASGSVSVGHVYAGGVFAPSPEHTPATAAPQSVVTRRQAMLALLAAGKLDAVEAVISQAPRAVQITWETARDFERTNPLIEALAPQLGLTEADVDALFIEASKL